MMYKVWLTNFGYSIYEGSDLDEAIVKAVKCGFECEVFHPDGVLSYSPISGWKGNPVKLGLL